MIELATLHRWSPQQVARLRVLRRRWRELERDADQQPAGATQLGRLEAENGALRAENIALLTRLAFAEASRR